VFDVSEERSKDNKKYTVHSVCYRAVVSLTVCAPDGTVLATYVDGATGEAKNQPSHGDAHDLAMKTALSQALKRAAVNLGDQYGLSLYAKGSTSALVGRTLVYKTHPEAKSAEDSGDVDAHIDEQLPAEDSTADEPRTRSAQPAMEPPTADSTADIVAAAIYAELLAGNTTDLTYQQWVGGLMKRAQQAKCLAVAVDTDAGPMALKLLLQQAVQNAA
jgi:recombination DNA repair RAD52 pathway protein